MADYKTPGVYVLEKNSFGSSIVANATAVPMFIGFTEKAVDKIGENRPFIKGSTSVVEPVLISSALEYAQYFGGADTNGQLLVTCDAGNEALGPYKVSFDADYAPGLLHPSVLNYFGNGGGSCYIVSTGDYTTDIATYDPAADLASFEIAIELAEITTLILPTDMIRCGAAKYYDIATKLVTSCAAGDKKKYFSILDVVPTDPNSSVYDSADSVAYRVGMVSDSTSYAAAYFPYLKSLTAYSYADITKVKLNGAELDPATIPNSTIESVKAFLATNYINMPSSPFMAGIYSKLDNASGVWTPPANTAPSGVTGPVVNITNTDQQNLNVDGASGKSINAIRSFTGKGTLVWGARTNDGNSLDWRYINVRRLFMAMENDISQALEAYVFKPNVHNTWVEVKTMIESYLFGLYGDGAFAGTTPETSYNVSIGVGETMTDEDVLNGYMRASIQVAPVRPAEFIVLTFSQMIGQ